MTISCNICGQKFTSVRPAAEQQQDVLVQMTNHLGSHQEQAVSLAKDVRAVTQLMATYLLIKKYVRIPPEETALLANYEEMEDLLADVFEFDLVQPDANEEALP